MGKVLSRARQWRLEYAAKIGRSVSIREVAEAIGEDRRVVMNLEDSEDMERPNMGAFKKLCDFYHQAGIDTRVILEYDPNGRLAPNLSPAVQIGG
jgi:hypothetical protein